MRSEIVGPQSVKPFLFWGGCLIVDPLVCLLISIAVKQLINIPDVFSCGGILMNSISFLSMIFYWNY